MKIFSFGQFSCWAIVALGGIAMFLSTGCQDKENKDIFDLSSQNIPQVTLQEEKYATARERFRTTILFKGPAPQTWSSVPVPADVREFPFISDGLPLKAWVSIPANKEPSKKPAVLFLHNGFAFGKADWDMSEPFRIAGFVVMTPMLRGENGLPGVFTWFY